MSDKFDLVNQLVLLFHQDSFQCKIFLLDVNAKFSNDAMS